MIFFDTFLINFIIYWNITFFYLICDTDINYPYSPENYHKSTYATRSFLKATIIILYFNNKKIWRYRVFQGSFKHKLSFGKRIAIQTLWINHCSFWKSADAKEGGGTWGYKIACSPLSFKAFYVRLWNYLEFWNIFAFRKIIISQKATRMRFYTKLVLVKWAFIYRYECTTDVISGK